MIMMTMTMMDDGMRWASSPPPTREMVRDAWTSGPVMTVDASVAEALSREEGSSCVRCNGLVIFPPSANLTLSPRVASAPTQPRSQRRPTDLPPATPLLARVCSRRRQGAAMAAGA